MRFAIETTINLATVAGTVLAFFGFGMYAAIPAAVVAASTAFSKFHGTEKKLTRFNDTLSSVSRVLLWWRSMDVEKANLPRITELIDRCEESFQSERQAWVSSSMATQMLSGKGEGEKDKDKEKTNGAADGDVPAMPADMR